MEHAKQIEKPTIKELKAIPYNHDIEMEEWIRSRPNTIKRMMIKFPPNCLLQAAEDGLVMVPGKGKTAVLLSWTEPTKECPDGQVSVVEYPNGTIRAWCRPEWLKVVGYTYGFTPEKVKEILGWKDE